MKTEHIAMDVNDVVGLFTASIPKSIETKNTSHGDNDFREALLVDRKGSLKSTVTLVITVLSIFAL